MTVPTEVSSIVYTATGTTDTFEYTWQIVQDADLIVYTLNAAMMVITPLVLDTDYTVTGANVPTGGTIVLTDGNPTAGVRIFIASDPEQIQELLLQQGAAINLPDIMAALDLLTREVQANRRLLSVSLQIPVAESLDGRTVEFPPAALRAGSLVGFDASGNATISGLTPSILAFTSAATIAALKAVSVPANGTVYEVAGYNTVNDGGGGLFVYIAADATTDNGGTVFAPDVGSGRWNRLLDLAGPIDLRWFGATGNGSTDDTTRIQAAFTYGGSNVATMWVPAGYTFIYSALTIPSNLRLTGYGTLKRKTTNSITSGEHYTLDATGSSNWSIDHVTFDGNRAGQTGAAGFKVSGLLIRGSSNVRIDGATFVNWHQDCIEITCATQSNPIGPDTPPAQPADTIRRVQIANCAFRDSGQNYDAGFGYSDAFAIQIGSTTEDVSVLGCVFSNCMTGPVAAAYNQRLRIADNTLYVDSATYPFRSTAIGVEQMSDSCTVTGNVAQGFREGVNVESPSRCTVTGNVLKDCLRGVSAFASNIGAVPINMREIVITGNTVLGAVDESIRVVLSAGNACFDATVSGNVTKGGSTGVSIQGVSGFAVTGNHCTGASSGIVLNGALTNGTVSGNTCRSSTAEGIFVGASSGNCTRVTISGNTSCNNGTYGLDIAAGQTDLTVVGNTLLSNTTKDLRIGTPATNGVHHRDNRFLTFTNALRTLTASGQAVAYGAGTYLVDAASYAGLISHTAGERYSFVCNGAVTFQHNTGAGGSKFYNRASADLVLAINQAVTYASDGTNLYEC